VGVGSMMIDLTFNVLACREGHDGESIEKECMQVRLECRNSYLSKDLM
jgi:hypothetical protein